MLKYNMKSSHGHNMSIVNANQNPQIVYSMQTILRDERAKTKK